MAAHDADAAVVGVELYPRATVQEVACRGERPDRVIAELLWATAGGVGRGARLDSPGLPGGRSEG